MSSRCPNQLTCGDVWLVLRACITHILRARFVPPPGARRSIALRTEGAWVVCASAQGKKQAALAADEPEEDDEVERVVDHRPVPGNTKVETYPTWEEQEFRVKWKRWSYLHNSWDTYSTLSQLGGFKRVQVPCSESEPGRHEPWIGFVM
jgi:hypothetical protein